MENNSGRGHKISPEFLQSLGIAEGQIRGWIASCETEEQLENCNKAVDAIILQGFQTRIPQKDLQLVSERLKTKVGQRIGLLQGNHSKIHQEGLSYSQKDNLLPSATQTPIQGDDSGKLL